MHRTHPLEKKKLLKYTFRSTFIRGPPYNAYLNPKSILKEKDPQKYVYQGSPPIMPIKTQKKNNKKRKQKRQNLPSEIRLSGVPPMMLIKTKKKYIIKKVNYP